MSSRGLTAGSSKCFKI
ncbi:palindromic element RPE4 domain-containing protein [Kangiella sp. HD9-110m-PIT-SAG07]|nr:palindromic element RPE4 domain-containing protein [Kangiella sp. HD9-110m-PIT-SAG07]